MPNFDLLKNPILLALDLDNGDEALALACRLANKVGGFKVGPRLCFRYGAKFVQKLSQMGPVFVDNKYFDIPSTMEASVQASFESGASLVTVHALAGEEALSRLVELEAKLNKQRAFRILAVTVLTSFSSETLPKPLKGHSVDGLVQTLAGQAYSAGIRGLVCSPHEVSQLKQNCPEAFLVTPGVRLEVDASEDQKRITTPEQAIANGASALVIGRSILKAEDPVEAAHNIFERIEKA
jgi:orotidine-5'-phosphate decarboxylase